MEYWPVGWGRAALSHALPLAARQTIKIKILSMDNRRTNHRSVTKTLRLWPRKSREDIGSKTPRGQYQSFFGMRELWPASNCQRPLRQTNTSVNLVCTRTSFPLRWPVMVCLAFRTARFPSWMSRASSKLCWSEFGLQSFSPARSSARVMILPCESVKINSSASILRK